MSRDWESLVSSVGATNAKFCPETWLGPWPWVAHGPGQQIWCPVLRGIRPYNTTLLIRHFVKVWIIIAGTIHIPERCTGWWGGEDKTLCLDWAHVWEEINEEIITCLHRLGNWTTLTYCKYIVIQTHTFSSHPHIALSLSRKSIDIDSVRQTVTF